MSNICPNHLWSRPGGPWVLSGIQRIYGSRKLSRYQIYIVCGGFILNADLDENCIEKYV